ncbi:transposase [Streptomyces zhihengii]
MGRRLSAGLLLDGGRKSVEPMAARLGEEGNRQALAHFVTSSPWDAAHVRARLAWRIQPVIKPIALVIDDTGFLKDGDASACVTRQYTGTAGKVTNCQAGVSLHLASNSASAAVNWRLFLPGAGIPPHRQPIRPRSPAVTSAPSLPRWAMSRSGSWPST